MPKLKTLTPECDKMLEVRDFSQKIGEFLDWLKHEQKIALCRFGRLRNKDGQFGGDGFLEAAYLLPNAEEKTAHKFMDEQPSRTVLTTTNLLAAFFEIDLDKAEDEKQAMLAELRRKP